MSEQKKFLGWSLIRWSVQLVGALVIIVVLIVGTPLLLNNGPVNYTNIVEHFKYGSIGSEIVNGIPERIWKVFPILFDDKLQEIADKAGYQFPGQGYRSLGFIYEQGKDLPVGFSQRKSMGIEQVGLNCAVCHVGLVRDSKDSKPRIVEGMSANTLNLMGYIKFLSAIAVDERFNSQQMMPYIEAQAENDGTTINPVEKLLYKFLVIPLTREGLIRQRDRLAFVEEQPEWGPGRVDTFNPYKAIQFNFPMDKLEEKEKIGASDFPVIWNQEPREGLKLHWDGNNDSVRERNLSAALGAGVTPAAVDLPGIKRVADWLCRYPYPQNYSGSLLNEEYYSDLDDRNVTTILDYPYEINEQLAAKGKVLYKQNCLSCHSFSHDKPQVEPIEKIGTDPFRLDSFTETTLSNQNTLFAGIESANYDESCKGKIEEENLRFKRFRKTNGYANMPLDWVWLRAPYLHNGSVPSLRDLLEKPENRPQVFYRGNDLFDRDKVGFVSDVAEENGRKYFKFDTDLDGNSNSGHYYGTDLSPEEKEALVEYMKKL